MHFTLRWVLFKGSAPSSAVTVQRAPSGEWCIKGKRDIVNDDCTVCGFDPWRVVAGLMWALVFAE